LTVHLGPDESTPAEPASSVPRQGNPPARLLGAISLLLVVAGVGFGLHGLRAPDFHSGPVTFDLNEVSWTSVGGLTWYDVFRQHEFSVGLTLALTGIIGAIALLSFHAWRGTGTPRVGSASITEAPVNGAPRLLVGLAGLLAVLGVVAIIVGTRYESRAFLDESYFVGTGWWDVIARRAYDLGLIGLALALLALFARLVFAAWRFERRSVPVAAAG